MQLLKITSIPIEYKIQIENAHLELKQPQPQVKMDRTPPELTMRSEDIKARLDTTDMRSSMGLKSAKTQVEESADQGMQAAQEATAQYAEFGNQMAQKGMTIRDIVANQVFADPFSTRTVFLPSVGPAISWQPNELQMNYDKGKLDFDWQIMKNQMDYVPGKFQMNILQYPKVKIEYLGEPNYVPPSANPNYKA